MSEIPASDDLEYREPAVPFVRLNALYRATNAQSMTTLFRAQPSSMTASKQFRTVVVKDLQESDAVRIELSFLAHKEFQLLSSVAEAIWTTRPSSAKRSWRTSN